MPLSAVVSLAAASVALAGCSPGSLLSTAADRQSRCVKIQKSKYGTKHTDNDYYAACAKWDQAGELDGDGEWKNEPDTTGGA